MKNNLLNKAKYIVKVISNKVTHDIKIESIYDKKANRYLYHDEIIKRGLRDYTYSDSYNKDNQVIYRTALDDLKEDLNWMLDGDNKKYRFIWSQSGKDTSVGISYIFD